ncbi:MAG: metallophosphoesterase [Verrucomicrobiales bacterium]|nr:metallophosphoesterase [Verrucomicrobiales bacterium]
MPEDVVTFVHLSDTHLGSTYDAEYYGTKPAVELERVVAAINALPEAPDFVVHTGDICGGAEVDSQGTKEGYQLARQIVSTLKVPFYAVAGNHDSVPLIRRFLPPGLHQPLVSDRTRLAYTFRARFLTGVILDAREGPGPAGFLPDDQLEALDALLSMERGPVCIFLHFPFLPIGVGWVDELAVKNGEALQSLLGRHHGRVRGSFFGHIHSPLFVTTDGLLAVSAPSPAIHFRLHPGMLFATIPGSHPKAWHVTLSNKATRILSLAPNC